MIAWYDNVPLLSFALLGARCRHCRAAIHWRYPLVETLTGVATAVVVARFGAWPLGAVYLVFVWLLIAISFIDLEHRIIPLGMSVGGLIFALVASALCPQMHGTSIPLLGLSRAVLGAFVGTGLLYLTGSIGSLCFRKEAMGLGDVDLMAMAGAFLGWKAVVLTFFMAPLLAVAPGLFVLVKKKSHEIPYGPFLSIALIAALFAGQRIIDLTGIEHTVGMIKEYYLSGLR